MRSPLLTLGLAGVVLGAAGAGVAQRVARPDSVPAAVLTDVKNAPSSGGVLARTVMRNLLDEQTNSALQALSSLVTQHSDADGLRLALHAYYAFRTAHPDEVRKPYLYYVDYGLDSRTPRGYVFDMDALRLVDGPFTVAHGRGSSRQRYGVPTRFSNSSGAATSSLGLYLTQESYPFTGHTSGRPYSSIGLRLEGESGRFNDAARARGVVMHGAPYVTAAGSGRSEGCPAVEPARARRLIPLIAEGSVVFLYSPNDTQWTQQDPWANAPGTMVTTSVPAASPDSVPAPGQPAAGDAAQPATSPAVNPPSSR